MAQSKTLGHQLANDHGAVRDTEYNDTKSERSTVGGDHGESAHPGGRPLSKRVAAKGTGQNPDESYAQLNRGEKRIGRVGQFQSRSCPGLSVAGQLLQARLARGNHGNLRHGKDAVSDEK